MPVVIEELETVVETSSASASTAPGDAGERGDGARDGSSPWPAAERLRAAAARLARVEARVRARGFHD